MRKMEFSNEFVVVVLSIMALSFMYALRLLKQMRHSAWNIEYYAAQTQASAETVAGKAVFI